MPLIVAHTHTHAPSARIHPKSITYRDFRLTPGIYQRHARAQIFPPQFKNADVIAAVHADEQPPPPPPLAVAHTGHVRAVCVYLWDHRRTTACV